MRRTESNRRPLATAPLDLTVTRLGAGGDGVASGTDGGTIHIPRTLPGEQVRARLVAANRAVGEDIVRPSADRVTPPCPHFADCGGCALQHFADASYAAWKCHLVADALARAGFADAVISPLARTPPGARRRFDFGAARIDGGVALGLNAAHSDALVDLHACLVLHPDLARLLDPLRGLLRSLDGLRRRADVVATRFPGGIDLLLRLDALASAGDRGKLAAFATAQGIARIATAVGQKPAETASLLRAPSIGFDTVSVTPPSGAFVQASAEGEAAIVAAVLAGLPARLPARSRIVELFAGIGTLSFPLAKRARVQAFEGNADAVAALSRAAGGTRVSATQRDLARQPLQASEFAGAACVVLDPPFAGAAAQMAPLAAARVPRVIYVSCNAAALQRDTAVLRQAGYALVDAIPIDQFLWSAQVEAVCIFEEGTSFLKKRSKKLSLISSD